MVYYLVGSLHLPVSLRMSTGVENMLDTMYPAKLLGTLSREKRAPVAYALAYKPQSLHTFVRVLTTPAVSVVRAGYKHTYLVRLSTITSR